ncbi:MAG: acetolactate synthase [Planctomycetota bacterium]|nr:acetolactate synthase [Planctomycetota bacterium]
MSQAPLSNATSRGYEHPRNIQFSVFINNRVGQLLELIQIFDNQALTIAAINVIDSADYSVVRMVTSHSDLARSLLERTKHSFSVTEILVVDLGVEAKLTELCAALLSAEINIHFAYPLLVRPAGHAAVALHCDDRILATEVLLRRRFQLLAENDLGENGTPGEDFVG